MHDAGPRWIEALRCGELFFRTLSPEGDRAGAAGRPPRTDGAPSPVSFRHGHHLARTLGAQPLGLDSPRSRSRRRAVLPAATGSPATFVCADVYETRKAVPERFDLVFSSYGAIGWLPELATWPTSWPIPSGPGGASFRRVPPDADDMLAEDFSEIKYSYFKSRADHGGDGRDLRG